MTRIMVDPHEMVARVEPRVDPKYARKIVQDWLKANTQFKNGWFVSITNLHEDADHWDMQIFNDVKASIEAATMFAEIAESMRTKHLPEVHATGTTIDGRVFLFCPIGNICSWSSGDVQYRYCEWCKKFFDEMLPKHMDIKR